jgi:hypothetical protein
MTEQPVGGNDERVARLIAAARDLVDAYQNRSTANQHFLELQQAVEALDSGRRPAAPAQDAPVPPAEP